MPAKAPYRRIRHRPFPPQEPVGHTTWRTGYNPQPESTIGSYPGAENGEWMVDTVTPGYKKIQDEGGIICTPMQSASEDEVAYPAPTYNNSYRSGTNTWTVYYANYMPVAGDGGVFYSGAPSALTWKSFTDEDRHAAINAAYASAYDSVAHVLTDVAELKKTLSMLKRDVQKARELLEVTQRRLSRKQVRTRKRKGIRILLDWADVASDTYLEVRFGWLPLLRSIEDAVKALAVIANRPVRVTGRGFDSISDSDVWEDTTQIPSYATGELVDRTTNRTTISVNRQLRAGVLCEVDISAGHVLGLDLQSGLLSAWDLIPYSFIVDRIVRVGDWIAAMSPRPNVKVLASWLTETSSVVQQDFTIKLASSQTSIDGRKTSTYGAAEGSIVTVMRSKNRSVNVQVSDLPALDLNGLIRNLTNVLDEVSLLYQGVRRRA